MKPDDIARLRITQQAISLPLTSVTEVVQHLGAMQAQDYPGALWSVGLRLVDATQTTIEAAIDQRHIVRTWAMRGTLHFVPPGDIRWMLDLFAPLLISGAAARRRSLAIDDAVLSAAEAIIVAELQQHTVRTRDELCKLLDSQGIATAGQRGIHILRHLSLQKVLCFGPHQGAQPTFVLLDSWVPKSTSLSEQEALGLLAQRYFTSHGPATLQDFIGWSGLSKGRATVGLQQASAELQELQIQTTSYFMASVDKQVTNSSRGFLLPGFDEFMLGYRDRSAALPAAYANRICPGGNGMFMPTLVLDGHVIGTWKKQIKSRAVTIQAVPFEPITPVQKEAFVTAASRYGHFLGKPAVIQW